MATKQELYGVIGRATDYFGSGFETADASDKARIRYLLENAHGLDGIPRNAQLEAQIESDLAIVEDWNSQLKESSPAYRKFTSTVDRDLHTLTPEETEAYILGLEAAARMVAQQIDPSEDVDPARVGPMVYALHLAWTVKK